MASMNPWTLAALQSRSLLYPALPASFAAQLVALQLLYALAIAFGLAGLGARIYRRTFYLYRIQNGRIIPNTAVAFISFKTLFCIFCLVGTFRLRDVYVGGGDQTNVLAWRSLIWIPLLLSSSFEAWGTIASCNFGSKPSTLATTRTSTNKAHTLIHNIVLSTIPLVVSLSILVPLLLANNNFNLVWTTYLQLDSILQKAASSFNGTPDPRVQLQLAQPTEDLARYLALAMQQTRIGYVFYIDWVTLFFAVFGFGAQLVFSSLSNQVNACRRSALALRTASLDSTTEKNSQRRPSANKNDIDEAMTLEAKILSLEATKRQLWLQGLVYITCWIGYFVATVTVAVDPLQASVDPSRFTWITLVSYWIFAIPGTVGLFLVFLNGFTSTGSFTGTTLRPAPLQPIIYKLEDDDFDFSPEELQERMGIQSPAASDAHSIYDDGGWTNRNGSKSTLGSLRNPPRSPTHRFPPSSTSPTSSPARGKGEGSDKESLDSKYWSAAGSMDLPRDLDGFTSPVRMSKPSNWRI